MTPEQIEEYHAMKMYFDNYKNDSKRLDKIYSTLLQMIPTGTIISFLKKKKLIRNKYDFKEE